MAMRRGMLDPSYQALSLAWAVDPTAVRLALTGPAGAWLPPATMRNPDPGCVFCLVVQTLEGADTCPAGDSGHVLRKIQDLPASIALLAPDQYYRGYTLVIAKSHATELFELPERESTQYYADMLRVARAVAAAIRPRKMN
jgi:hypothetical protein